MTHKLTLTAAAAALSLFAFIGGANAAGAGGGIAERLSDRPAAGFAAQPRVFRGYTPDYSRTHAGQLTRPAADGGKLQGSPATAVARAYQYMAQRGSGKLQGGGTAKGTWQNVAQSTAIAVQNAVDNWKNIHDGGP